MPYTFDYTTPVSANMAATLYEGGFNETSFSRTMEKNKLALQQMEAQREETRLAMQQGQYKDTQLEKRRTELDNARAEQNMLRQNNFRADSQSPLRPHEIEHIDANGNRWVGTAPSIQADQRKAQLEATQLAAETSAKKDVIGFQMDRESTLKTALNTQDNETKLKLQQAKQAEQANKEAAEAARAGFRPATATPAASGETDITLSDGRVMRGPTNQASAVSQAIEIAKAKGEINPDAKPLPPKVQAIHRFINDEITSMDRVIEVDAKKAEKLQQQYDAINVERSVNPTIKANRQKEKDAIGAQIAKLSTDGISKRKDALLLYRDATLDKPESVNLFPISEYRKFKFEAFSPAQFNVLQAVMRDPQTALADRKTADIFRSLPR